MNNNIFEISKNTYDVFIGAGWENWIRIQWRPVEKKWHTINGNHSLFRNALMEFNKEKGIAQK